MLKKIVCLLFAFSFITVNGEKGKVYLIPGSDTSVNPYGGMNIYDGRLWSAALYADPNQNGHKVMNPAFREQYRDSYGTPLKMTWWMMAGNVFHLSRNCNVPVRNSMTLYLMKKYHLDAIEAFDDQLTLHYHNYYWSDTNGDGIYWWNQGMDFLLNLEDYEETLCKYLIEEDVFPVSFRSGWHYMDNAWQAYQERFIPFDMSNAYPAIGGDENEPSWYIDWSQSPSAFVPYHPNADNYQIAGDLRQWRLRSVFIQDVQLMRANLDTMFREAAEGNDQMGCFWGHLAEGGFLSGIANLDALAHEFSAQYDVEFRYCKDVEAMRLWINPADTVAPLLAVTEIPEGDQIRFAIETDGPVFQAEEPFIAIKTVYETYRRLSCARTGENRWQTDEAIPASILAKAAVAVCDSVGNQAKKHFDYVPDDVFVDDQHPEFQEISGNWQNYETGQLWNLKARQLLGAGAVRITPNIAERRAYRISFHGPGSNSNSVRCIVQNTVRSDTIWFDAPLAGSDHWQDIGIFELQSGTGNTLTIENLAANKMLGLDVIRFTPLVAEKQAVVGLDSLDFGDVVVGDTTVIDLAIGNLGSGVLNIWAISHASGEIAVGADFPLAIAPLETRHIPVSLVTQQYGEHDDQLIIHTDDPLHSMIRLPVRANAVSYFKVADNDDPDGYAEFGADWFTSSGTAYGPSSRCAWIQGNDPYADFTKILDYSGVYDVQFIVPVTANAHDHAVYRILVDGSPLAMVIKDQNQGSGQFVSLGEYPLPGEVPITVRVQDFGGNTNPGANIVLRADAVRFRLLPEMHLMLDNDSLDFAEVSIEDTTIRYLTVSNLTSGDLNILTMAPSGDHITVDADFPLALAPLETREIPIAFFSRNPIEYRDTLLIHTDDTLQATIPLPVHAVAMSYFKVADNDDPAGYEESGAEWFSIHQAGYGPGSRCAWVRGNGDYADFTSALKYDGHYDIQYIVPAVENAHDHAEYVILVNGSAIDTVVADQNQGDGKFVSLGTYSLPGDMPVTVRVQDNGGNTNPHAVLYADAVKFLRVPAPIPAPEIPDRFTVFQNYPNPFNASTRIRYGLPQPADVRLVIYDIIGRKIRDWHIRSQLPGWHEIVWDGANHRQQPVASGIYIYQIHAGEYTAAKKMVFLK